MYGVETYRVSQDIQDAAAQMCGYRDAAALEAEVAAERAKLSPEVRDAVDEATREAEHAFLFGA